MLASNLRKCVCVSVHCLCNSYLYCGNGKSDPWQWAEWASRDGEWVAAPPCVQKKSAKRQEQRDKAAAKRLATGEQAAQTWDAEAWDDQDQGAQEWVADEWGDEEWVGGEWDATDWAANG